MSLLHDFIQAAPSGTEAALAALACAESLTDSVALAIYERKPVAGLSASDFVSAFKYSSLTEPRNSEWNIAPALRNELVASPALDRETRRAVHRLLLDLGKNEGNRTRAGSEVPAYLFTPAGLAYHLAGSGELADAMAQYSEASKGGFTGAQWLAAKLAQEQEQTGIIPQGRVETTFLRAWVLLREGHREAAMPLFRRVAETNLRMREVAISLHIVGNANSRRQPGRAEDDLRRSIEIGEETGSSFHVAQALHSLANLLARQERFSEAEEACQRSIDILGSLGDQLGIAQTLHSLANLFTRQGRFREAEEAYQRSIDTDRELGNEPGVAQTLHSLANLFTRQGRFREAEEAYQRSIDIGERFSSENHLAQVLRSYALAIEPQSRDQALSLLQRSLEINRRLGNQHFASLVERTIGDVLNRGNR